MSKLSKRQKAMQGKVDHNRSYAVADALKLAKDFATAKFDESIDVAVSLGIDPRKSDQLVRGSVVLPAGTGKTVRVAVFAQGEKAEVAKAAGADIVGFEDLAADHQGWKHEFRRGYCHARCHAYRRSAWSGSRPPWAYAEPEGWHGDHGCWHRDKNAKAGQVQYRTDKGGIVHSTIGRASFDAENSELNLKALIEAQARRKPASSKGQYLKKVAVSSTMGPGVRVDSSTLQ